MQLQVLEWPRSAKQLVVIGLDLVLSVLATWLAFSLRLDTLHLPDALQLRVYVIAPCLAIPVFIHFGLYRAVFRYTGQAALMATAKAVAVYALALSAVLVSVQWTMVPRSLGILQPLVFLILVATSRALARFWLAGMGQAGEVSAGRLLIFGAGTAGVQTAVALAVSRQFTLVGFVDDDPAKCGRSINGVPVWPASAVTERIASEHVTDILLAIPSATRERRKAIVDALKALPVHVRTLPSMQDLASGRVKVQDFRELDIEDLLGRDPVPPRADLLAQDISGQVVMVTGAGGSIGSELARQIFAQHPKTLVLLDHSEFALYTIHQELLSLRAGVLADITLVPVLARVSDNAHMKALCLRHRPATVYHAAAYKHVPLVEFNPGQGVLNNVFGTLSVAAAALEAQVGRFVLISTDKAVRPTNIMGASKRMAELVLQALAQRHGGPDSTCFSMVRFGNVLGSSGSVVPFFRQQLAAGGPLTLTHPEVTRYFMTITEAAQLVLQAGAMGQGGDVFVLDMGEPVKILDLAHRMVQLAGLSVRDAAHPGGDIEIAITGLRPGEKLYEELLIGDNPQSTLHPRIMKAHEDMLPWDVLQEHLSALRTAAVAEDEAQIRAVLAACVQGFSAPQAAPV